MAPGARSSLAPPMFEPEVLRKKFTALKKVFVTMLGLFAVSRSDSAPEELCPPCPPRYGPVRRTSVMENNLTMTSGGLMPHLFSFSFHFSVFTINKLKIYTFPLKKAWFPEFVNSHVCNGLHETTGNNQADSKQ